MCLTVKGSVTEKVKKKFKLTRTGYIICYKILSKYNTSIYRNVKWKAGWFKSNRTKDYPYEQYKVYCGLHLYLNEEDAIKDKSYRDKIIKVRCYEKDLVAGGKFGSLDSVVFSKVWVPKKELLKNG